jgi:hypothetical protein
MVSCAYWGDIGDEVWVLQLSAEFVDLKRLGHHHILSIGPFDDSVDLVRVVLVWTEC